MADRFARKTDTATARAAQAPAFSRSTGLPLWMGKATAEIKGKVPEGMKEDFARRAHDLRVNESELLRDVLMLYLYGREEVERMQVERVRIVAEMSHLSARDNA